MGNKRKITVISTIVVVFFFLLGGLGLLLSFNQSDNDKIILKTKTLI